MKIILLLVAFFLAVDLLVWLAYAATLGAWPRSRPFIFWPFIWAKRRALRIRGTFI